MGCPAAFDLPAGTADCWSAGRARCAIVAERQIEPLLGNVKRLAQYAKSLKVFRSQTGGAVHIGDAFAGKRFNEHQERLRKKLALEEGRIFAANEQLS